MELHLVLTYHQLHLLLNLVSENRSQVPRPQLALYDALLDQLLSVVMKWESRVQQEMPT